jgi:hypothetical protein
VARLSANRPRNAEMNVEDLDGHRFRMGSDATGPVDEEALKRLYRRGG